jgi:hypothetical protein
MPYMFIIVGLVMVIAAVRNTVADTKDTNGNVTDAGLATLLKQDVSGQNNFVYWVLSILIIGAIGYIKPLQPVSRAFMLLVIIVLFLSNKGVFSQFNSAFAGKKIIG